MSLALQVFDMMIPPHPAKHPNQSDHDVTDVRPGDGCALVVESDLGSSSVVCRCLSELGFGITAVVSGVEAVIAARVRKPAVIFLAIQLRDVTGSELVTWLRANPELATVPLIAMHALGEDAPDIMTVGFNALLRTPTSVERVSQAIQRACAGVA